MKTAVRIGNGTSLVTDGALKYIEFDCLKQYGSVLTHFMSTRAGGVSTGECSTLNLGFNRNDSRENVIRNFQLLCEAAGIDTQSLVLTNQIHDTVVRSVGESDRGKGFSRESDIKGVDGLLTVQPGVTLVTFHADCVPVFLFEPGINAAALLHSGWRSTLKNIAAEAVRKMELLPDFKADRLIAVTGPSIGKCCFEVGEEVYVQFAGIYTNAAFYQPMGNGKWKIDLQAIIQSQLTAEGLEDENIHHSGICTKCRSDLFFSYRGDKGATGSLAAFMQLKLCKES